MPDFGAPVAQSVDVSPNKGIQTLSDLMGLQQRQIQIEQQKQTLQTGAALQQTAQAQAQSQQQAMGERQLLQSSMQSGKDPDGNALLGTNGEADPVAMTRFANKFLPLTGQDVVQHIVKTQDDRLKLGDTVRQLGQNYRNDLSGIVRSSIGTNDDTAAKIDAYVQQQGPNAPAGLVDAATHAKSLLQNLNPQVPDGHRDKALLHLAQQFQPSGALASEQQPTMENFITPEGKIGQRQINPRAPEGMGPVGPATAGGVPPQIVTPPGGVPQVFPGGRGPLPTSFGGGGPSPTQTDVENFGRYNANLDNRVQVASDLIPRVQQAEQALSQIRAGGGAPARANFAKFLQSVPGVPPSLIDGVAGGDLAKTQEAEKYLFQTTFAGLKQSMQGDPARVAEFNSAEQVFPSLGTDPRATKAVLTFMKDQANRDFAEQQALKQARTSGTFNPVTWQADYQRQLRAAAVPGVPSSQVPKTAAAGATPTASRGNTVTQAEVDAYAKKYKLTPDAARAHVQANGFTIQ